MIRVLRSSRNEIVVLRGFVCNENIYRKGCAIMLLPTRNLYRFLLVEFLVLLSLCCVRVHYVLSKLTKLTLTIDRSEAQHLSSSHRR